VKPRKTKLAASFVVTVAAGTAVASLGGCRKEAITDPPVNAKGSAFVHRNGDRCTMSVPENCPKGASCNPPAPTEIDCPPSHRDAGEPVPSAGRPPGKEDWLRVRPKAWGSQYGCTYVAEYFCAAPPKPHECTSYPPPVQIKCTPVVADAGVDAGKPAAPPSSWLLESFVYKDGLGTCHRVPSFVCTGDCIKDMPADTPAPCP
jgi:hypothetical protein